MWIFWQKVSFHSCETQLGFPSLVTRTHSILWIFFLCPMSKPYKDPLRPSFNCYLIFVRDCLVFPQLLAFVHTCYVISTFSDEDDGCEYSWSRVHTEIRHGITHNSSASFELFCFLLFYTCPCICSVQVVVWTQLCSFSSSSSSPFLVVNFIGDFHHPSKPHFFF